MRMAHYETYQSNAAEVPQMRKWLFRGLLLSLGLHGGLIAFFHAKELHNFGYTGEERLAPPTRVMSRVEIPEIKEDTTLTLPTSKAPIVPIPLEADKPEVLQIAPQIVPEMAKPIVSEKPQALPGGIDTLAQMQSDSIGALEKQLSKQVGGMMDKSTRVKGQPIITVPTAVKRGDGGLASMAGMPGRQSLDDALARTGPLPVGDKPIGMPGGALYEYNSYELRPEAQDELRKLGELIKRNPRATFSIEGHTDSIGTPEYNQTLSERRAESVKLWLVQFMGIAPERIQTKGLGSTKLIVPGDKSVDEQQPNRRVEIVIKTNR